MAANQVDKLIEPYVDLGNLLLIDRDPNDELPNIDAEQLAELTRKNVQFLFNKIWTLPRKVVQDATCAQLPECEYQLPREKQIPKPKEPTKWECFAKEKGIVKQKKSKKMWDETEKEWKPRYGYRRANNEKKNDWLIEIPDQADPYKNYFEERADAKRERIHKQELQRLKNVGRAHQQATKPPPSDSVPTTPLGSQSAAFKQHMGQNQQNGTQRKGAKSFENNNLKKPLGLGLPDNKSREELTHQLNRARNATASMGKFQPTLKGEKAPRNTGIKRKYEPNEGNTDTERKRQMEILEKLQSKKPKLAESRIGAVNEHLVKMEKRSKQSAEGVDGGSSKKENNNRKAHGKRSKSQIDRQQRFQHIKKQSGKSGFKSFRSKAGKATARKSGGGDGGKGRK